MKDFLVNPGSNLTLAHCFPDDTGEYRKTKQDKEEVKTITKKLTERLSELQEHLYANGDRSLLIVMQGMDTSGKDSTIKHVMSHVNPQGCKVSSFKKPSEEEVGYDFLWRVHHKVPSRGQIGIFNRSHYEDVLVNRVHGLITDKTVKQRFDQIKEFEELLSENGTVILKFFLHISKDEQKKRLEERRDNPEKRWKFNDADLKERKLWEKYIQAYEITIAATSTTKAPWHIVPANYKWYRNLVIADRIVNAMKGMKIKAPLDPEGINFDTLKIE